MEDLFVGSYYQGLHEGGLVRSGWPRHLYAGTHSFGFALLDTGTYSYKVIPGKSTFITLFLALIKKIGHVLDSLDTVDIVVECLKSLLSSATRSRMGMFPLKQESDEWRR